MGKEREGCTQLVLVKFRGVMTINYAYVDDKGAAYGWMGDL